MPENRHQDGRVKMTIFFYHLDNKGITPPENHLLTISAHTEHLYVTASAVTRSVMSVLKENRHVKYTKNE